MEYTVLDLLKILLRRWYIILLSMAILTAIALFVSQASFNKVSEDYEKYTTETKPVAVQVGTLSATIPYQCDIADYDIAMQQYDSFASFYNNYVSLLPEDIFDITKKLDATSYAWDAYNRTSNLFSQLITSPSVVSKVNTKFSGQQEPLLMNTSLTAFNHFSVSIPVPNTLQVIISDLPEETANDALQTYLQALSINADAYNLTVDLGQSEETYTAAPLEYTERALFAQMTMKPPEAPPSKIRTIGMAMIFGFVLSCFAILLATFIKDSRRYSIQTNISESEQSDVKFLQ